MKQYNRQMIVVWGLVCLLLSACRPNATSANPETKHPVKIEHLEGKDPTRETLTEDATKRLGIKTATVSETQVNGTQRKTIPYSGILYDTQGNTWVYMNPAPQTFVRTPVVIDSIDGNMAILSEGPSSGTAVVTVGATELYGAEIEFAEE